ncbi:MAG: LysR substrate-binding domain-containing protein [Alsobacter sp.]|jgi:LysR family transcriptional regulator, glycine cleavage system transcriptional activator
MDRRLPPLVALRAFEAAARHGSMRQAADAMAVSHSVVSRHIRNLELWLGVRLFAGNRRSIALTLEGRAYFRVVSAALDRIASATEEIRPASPWQALNVWCVPGLASRWLVPMLDKVRQLIPDVEITIRPTLDVPDVAHGEVDLLITYGPIETDGLWETVLASPRVIPVARPAFISSLGPIVSPADLLHAPLLHEVSTDFWCQWFVASGVKDIGALKGPKLWFLNNVLDAARDGQGVALATEIVVRGEIEKGYLQPVIASEVRIGSYYLYTRREEALHRSLTRFREWVIAEFADLES